MMLKNKQNKIKWNREIKKSGQITDITDWMKNDIQSDIDILTGWTKYVNVVEILLT